MKKTIRLLSVAMSLVFIAQPGFAQTPGWPATAATIADYFDVGGSTAVSSNSRINMDMFGHYVTGASQLAPDDQVIAVAFDEMIGSPPYVNLLSPPGLLHRDPAAIRANQLSLLTPILIEYVNEIRHTVCSLFPCFVKPC